MKMNMGNCARVPCTAARVDTLSRPWGLSGMFPVMHVNMLRNVWSSQSALYIDIRRSAQVCHGHLRKGFPSRHRCHGKA